MFKNKILLVIVILAFLGAVVYSLRDTIEDFQTITQKERANYQNSMLNDAQNIIADKTNFKGFNYFEANEKYVIEADYQALSDENHLLLMTDSSNVDMKKAGKVSFDLEEKKITLTVFDEGKVFMLPFKDLSNGKETYGGGRYINIPKENLRNNKLEIDFNQAHNFYCAYNEGFICPVPPKENHIPLAIEAGEKVFH
jgi:uncharacterized protein (DUF1684 family)